MFDWMRRLFAAKKRWNKFQRNKRKKTPTTTEAWIVARGRFQWRQNMCWNDQLKTKCCVINGRPFAAVSWSLRIRRKTEMRCVGRWGCKCGAVFLKISTLKNICDVLSESWRLLNACETLLVRKRFIILANEETEPEEEAEADENVIISKTNRLRVSFNHFYLCHLPCWCRPLWSNLRIYIPFAIYDRLMTRMPLRFEHVCCGRWTTNSN